MLHFSGSCYLLGFVDSHFQEAEKGLFWGLDNSAQAE